MRGQRCSRHDYRWNPGNRLHPNVEPNSVQRVFGTSRLRKVPGSRLAKARFGPRCSLVNATQWVEQYNWDDGLVPIRALVDDPNTEFATALPC